VASPQSATRRPQIQREHRARGAAKDRWSAKPKQIDDSLKPSSLQDVQRQIFKGPVIRWNVKAKNDAQRHHALQIGTQGISERYDCFDQRLSEQNADFPVDKLGLVILVDESLRVGHIDMHQ